MTETMLHQAHVAGQARLAVACPGVSRSWRSARVASDLRRCGSAFVLPTNGYLTERQHPGRRPGVHGNGHDDQAAHPAPRNEEDVTPTSNLTTEAAGFRTRRPFSFFRLRHDQSNNQQSQTQQTRTKRTDR